MRFERPLALAYPSDLSAPGSLLRWALGCALAMLLAAIAPAQGPLIWPGEKMASSIDGKHLRSYVPYESRDRLLNPGIGVAVQLDGDRETRLYLALDFTF